MQAELQQFFAQFNIEPVEFILELDGLFFESTQEKESSEEKKETPVIRTEVGDKSISIIIPYSISRFLFLPNNDGEKEIMKTVLKGFSMYLGIKYPKFSLEENFVTEIVNKYLSPSAAKMILYVDSNTDLRIDTRWLLPFREIQESDVSKILDHLVNDLNMPKPIPEKINSKKEKKELCNKIVLVLVNKVTKKLKEFDADELLEWLMKLYERCVQKREFREIHIPAKIACFSSYVAEVEKMEQDEHELVRTSIALRSLIEFVGAKPQFGEKRVNLDDIDELLALMDQIISWGMLSDTIEFDMDHTEMGLLPSGRIGTDKSFVNEKLKPFGRAKIENDVHGYQNKFEKRLCLTIPQNGEEPTDEIIEIDLAFKDEFGISYTNLLQIKSVLIKIALEKENSTVVMPVDELKEKLKFELKKLTNEELKTGIELLMLKGRDSIAKAPEGYKQDDIYPWKYNRALSYLRKPIVAIQKKDGILYCRWAFRHVYSSYENLQSLLFSGRLKAGDGGLLSKYLAKVNNEKGSIYRNMVAEWLTKNTSLKVIPYEVKISENGHLIAGKDYGDIDILAIDEQRERIYAIECKNTVSARVIHEMKTELDNYLGRVGKNGLIQKHVERNNWLKTNVAQLSKFVSNPEEYTICSLVLTHEEIPTTYLAIHNLPLPVVSYQRLSRGGAKLLETL